MLTLAFDTATSFASVALVQDGKLLGESSSRAVAVLDDVDDLFHDARCAKTELNALVVGTGPGSFTGMRLGLATARALAFALEVPVAGVSSLHALAAGFPGAVPVIDAGRREIFTLRADAPVCLKPEDLELAPGTVCVGDGALRYRDVLEAKGAEIPIDAVAPHTPRARFHVQLAHDFGPAEEIEPLYLRVPDAEQKA